MANDVKAKLTVASIMERFGRKHRVTNKAPKKYSGLLFFLCALEGIVLLVALYFIFFYGSGTSLLQFPVYYAKSVFYIVLLGIPATVIGIAIAVVLSVRDKDGGKD